MNALCINKILLAFGFCIATLIFLFTYESRIPTIVKNFMKQSSKSFIYKQRGSSNLRRMKSYTCDSILSAIRQGHWISRNGVTNEMVWYMDHHLVNLRQEYNIPNSLQRPDGLCGNLNYDFVPQYHHMMFRAICDPNGYAPCCYDYKCAARSVFDCNCTNCIDSRQLVHAELNRWIPDVAECNMREYNSTEACDLLSGTSVVLAGDSFIRHVFVAMIMLLTGNFQNGALDYNAPTGNCRYKWRRNDK